MAEPHRAVRRVQEALRAAGVEARVVELSASTRTAREAAQAVGCSVGEIVKSLVFRRVGDGGALLVLASGTNRVDEKRLGEELGTAIERADADFVRAATGYAIGGVPPLGHEQPLETLIDADLLRYETVWAAAGTPHAVFPIAPADLVRATGARVVALRGR